MIRIEALHKSYNGTAVLQGIDLTIPSGETLVVLGRSGIGKSVLLRQILGMEKPDRGSVFVDDVCLSLLHGRALLAAIKQMGMLFQASALFDSLTVGENTAFYLNEHMDLSESETQKKVAEALALVGLSGKQKAMPSDLSGGMRKRAALARLIVYRPKILLYDEPTTGLDPITAMQINDLILQTQKELQATSVVVTHDLCSAFHIADRIALIHEGKIAYIGTKSAFVKADHPIVRAFIENAIPDGDLNGL